MSDNDDYLEIQPWPVAELAGHLIAQSALGRRSLIETDATADMFERETDRFELESWARLELTAWLTTQELDLLAAPVGSLREASVDRCERGLMIASTIAWALRVAAPRGLPIESDGTVEMDTLNWAPTPWTPVRNVLKALRVRGEEHLAEERERWEIILWRTSLFTDPTEKADDQAALQETVDQLREIRSRLGGKSDLRLDDGRPFADASPDELADIENTAEIRLRTLNWVCGFGESPTTAPLELEGEE